MGRSGRAEKPATARKRPGRVIAFAEFAGYGNSSAARNEISRKMRCRMGRRVFSK